MRCAEDLSDTEEKAIHICEPEIGRNLSDDEEKRSVRDLINCQEGRRELSSCQWEMKGIVTGSHKLEVERWTFKLPGGQWREIS
jgi:hypothetical protein